MKTKHLKQILALTAISLLLISTSYALEYRGGNGYTGGKNGRGDFEQDKSITAGCVSAAGATIMDLNNVEALIFTGGDMWWDLPNGGAHYEVPKGSGKHSLFAGSIWIGGTDVNGQLRVCAQKYRQNGNDNWPGPLKETGDDKGNVTPDMCLKYDKHFVITKNEVSEFRTWWRAANNWDGNTVANADLIASQFANYSIPQSIVQWPGINPEPDYAYTLAPFWDENGDGYYNPVDGDYPFYDLDKTLPCGTTKELRRPRLYGDKTLWWVYNDRGNIHTETDGSSIGMEIHAQSFAFATNDELNNMTFGNYELINRSSYTLQDCFFGVWTDADLGDANDDYVGTDVKRGLGYLYNGDEEDGTGSGNSYGKQPPAIGVDFFEGPYQDINGSDYGFSGIPDGCDESINGLNFNDGVVDNERWGMRRFLFFNNTSAITGDPDDATEVYNYLNGKWRDGTPMTYGGNAYGGTIPTDFVFPYNTDPCGWGTGGIPQPLPYWKEGANPGADRRFVQSAGPFTLEPGAVNDITVGMVWGRATSGGAWASVAEVQRADDKAQKLFDVCFKIIDGPNAPELDVIELDRQLLFHIYNIKGSNNYKNTPEDYCEVDPFIVRPTDMTSADSTFTFQGYQVFQLKDQTVSITDIENLDKARLVFQCDKQDTISRIINFEYDNALANSVPVLKVEGSNTGIRHSFTLTDDAFASGDKRLVNHKTYYYIAIAYGYNNFKTYNPNDPTALDGQKKPYLPSRSGVTGAVKTYAAIPHITSPTNGGTILNSQFGDGPKIVQIEGHGNGNNPLLLTQKTINEIMSGPPWRSTTQEYENGYGPVKIKVIDPLNVPAEEFGLKFIDSLTTITSSVISSVAITNLVDAKWIVYKQNALTKSDTVWSDSYISYLNEQIIPKWGISITINQVPWPASDNPASFQNGYISSSIEWGDPTQQWLNFVPDMDGCAFPNWIRCGTTNDADNGSCNDIQGSGGAASDKNQFFEKVVDGTWSPYVFAMEDYASGPIYNGVAFRLAHLINTNNKKLHSIQFVITKDKSKWSRCPVIEMCNYDLTGSFLPGLSEGSQYKYGIRKHASVDKNGRSDNVLVGDSSNANYSNYISSRGMGWFPGYAIDLETGERLNVAFGEDSRFPAENGRDMMWNPTNNLASDLWYLTGDQLELYVGGKHVIYVWGHNSVPTTGATGEIKYYMPGYDEGKFLYEKLSVIVNEGPSSTTGGIAKRNLWQNAMWVSMPFLSPEVQMQTNPTDPYYFIKTDVKVVINVANPYLKTVGDLAVDTAVDQNGNLPYYTFSLKDLVPTSNDNETAKASLDLIRVVPNPYYGYSGYELSQLENKVKITNLPQKCTISIYTVNGTLIRRFKKDNPLSYQDWDLKNEYNITIASGVYILHIDAPGIGEKILKWFGALRPIDLNNF